MVLLGLATMGHHWKVMIPKLEAMGGREATVTKFKSGGPADPTIHPDGFHVPDATLAMSATWSFNGRVFTPDSTGTTMSEGSFAGALPRAALW